MHRISTRLSSASCCLARRPSDTRSLASLLPAGICLLGLWLAALPTLAATYVLPSDPLEADRVLAERAPILLVGRVVSGELPDPSGQAFTRYRLRPERVLKVPAGETLASELTLRLPGGTDEAGRELWLAGVPRFRAGERVLLALRRQDGEPPEEVYGIFHLALGTFHEQRRDGRRLAQRPLDGGYFLDDASLASGGQQVLEHGRDFERFADWLQAWNLWRAGDQIDSEPRADYLLALPSASRPALSTRPRFRLSEIDVEGEPFNVRWPDFAAGSVDFFLFEGGQPDLAGGGAAEFQLALSAWNEAPASQVRYRYGGTTSADGGLSNYDGINTILFENPNDYRGFTSPFFCDDNGGGFGLVALGGPWFDRGTPVTHSYGGTEVLSALGADIVTNTDSRCILDEPGNAAEIFGHEIGHTLGFSHACGDAASGPCNTSIKDEALMRAFAHLDDRGARLNSDDRAAVAFLYAPQVSCTASTTSLCLQQGRFRVEANWARANGSSGTGTAVQLTPDTGYFWFFDSQNVELVVKVLDGCNNNQNFWVFAGGLTNVEVELLVTDTLTEVARRYVNPQRAAFQPIQDTSAFLTCP